MNKGVPRALVALVAGIGLGLVLSKVWKRQPVRAASRLQAELIRRHSTVVLARLNGFQAVELN